MNKKYKVYKLHFTSALHLGREKDDYAESLEFIHSDTLYAAITASLAKTGYDFQDDFEGDLGFSVSSLFPFYQLDKKHKASYFFPKSKKYEILDDNLFGIHKLIKKITWLEKVFFEKHIANESLVEYYQARTTEFGKEKPKWIKGNFLASENLPSNFIRKDISPRVSVSRTGKEDAKPFYMERLYFENYSGLFFIAVGNTKLLEEGLKILQHEGIGTDRNIGNGFFTVSKDEIDLNIPENTENAMCLSLFLPESEKQLKKFSNDDSAYSIIRRGGWITTNPNNSLRKNRIHMFEEGSVFKTESKEIETFGKIANLTPSNAIELGLTHKIFRNGKSIFVPIALKKD
jgi:CRISPR-associated protein Csm4